jgi:hypothetical protein
MSSNAAMRLMLAKTAARLRRDLGAAMIRASAILLLGGVACAHDHALDRRYVGAMQNASPAISPWTGPEADPIPIGQTDAGPEAVVNRVRAPAPQPDDHI